MLLIDDVNIDLIKYDSNIDSCAFLDKIYSSFLLLYISSPSRLTTRSKTLTYKLFCNNIEQAINSGDRTSTITDHYAQFLLLEIINPMTKKLQHSFKTMNKKVKSELNINSSTGLEDTKIFFFNINYFH